MAILFICAVRDAKLDAFSRPMFVPTLGVALRSFTDEVNRKESELHKHPEDYAMYHLGTFDEDWGKFESLVPAPKQLALASEVLVAVKSTP